MIETPNSNILSAIIILLIILILVIIASILYEKYKKYFNYNNQNIQKQTLEPFASYQDVKTKTINWCKQMQKVGLLTSAQYNQCIATFANQSGTLPKEFKVPATGLGRNFSLYDIKTADNNNDSQLSSSISGGNSNNVMLVTESGLYMGCKPDNSIYFIKNINDATINQQELYFTLVPRADNVYAIMSPYERYLITDTNWITSFTGTDIGPMSSWTINKIDNNKATFESKQYTGFYMSLTDEGNSLVIKYGNSDSGTWLMIPKQASKNNNNTNDTGTYAGADYIKSAGELLQTYKNAKTEILCLDELQKSIKTLQDKLMYNYTTIRASIDTLSSALDANIHDSAIKKIDDYKKLYIDPITDLIPLYQGRLQQSNQLDINNTVAYDKYIETLHTELNAIDVRIQNNNNIMDRQKTNNDKITMDYASILQNKDKYKKLDETAKINTDLVNGYKAQNSYLLIVYPIVIFILGLGLLYLSYITFIKFKTNIYDKY